MLVALSTLLALVLYDFAHQILPFSLLGVFIVASALSSFILAPSWSAFESDLLTALVLALLLAGIHVASRGRAMGLADAPFVFGCALLVGPAALPGFIFSFWIGAVIGILLLVRSTQGFRMGVEDAVCALSRRRLSPRVLYSMEPLHFRRGFTLIEMLVVLAIIVTVTTIALSSQSAFNKTLILANTAYDIALTLRSAENFGIGSRALYRTANAGYGVHFQRGTLGSFILFADTAPAINSSCTRPDCRPETICIRPMIRWCRPIRLGMALW